MVNLIQLDLTKPEREIKLSIRGAVRKFEKDIVQKCKRYPKGASTLGQMGFRANGLITLLREHSINT